MKHIFISLRLIATTVLVCCIAYPALIFAVGQSITPYTANGSILTDRSGKIIGSELIAQRFSQPEYFWARPSAVDYNGAGSGGSNLSPASPVLKKKALDILTRYNTRPEISVSRKTALPEKISSPEEMALSENLPVPIDLVTASGSGLDPHITLGAAMYQVPRVADARKIAPDQLRELVQKHSLGTCPGFSRVSTCGQLVNVLLLNMEIDKLLSLVKSNPFSEKSDSLSDKQKFSSEK